MGPTGRPLLVSKHVGVRSGVAEATVRGDRDAQGKPIGSEHKGASYARHFDFFPTFLRLLRGHCPCEGKKNCTQEMNCLMGEKTRGECRSCVNLVLFDHTLGIFQGVEERLAFSPSV
eukprot:10860950-Prorocentrum_lima.AAC.1